MGAINPIEQNLNNVKKLINSTGVSVGRASNSVSLVAVSKQHSLEAITQVFNAGHKVFGENRVQEALTKFPGLKEAHTDLELHLIGPLQTNKVRDAVNLFDVIETLDRPKLAKEIAGDRLVIQADGYPMSGGEDNYNTTLQAVATADVVNKAFNMRLNKKTKRIRTSFQQPMINYSHN